MNRRGREEWKKVIDELEESKLTHKEFAAQRGIALPTLQFWLYKFRRESRHESRPVFLPVEMVASTAPSARQPVAGTPPPALEAVLGSGTVLRFAAGTDVGYLRQLLAALA